MPVLDPYDQQFDPFAPDAFRPELPWYRKSSAVVALAAIALAVIAILVAAVLLRVGPVGRLRQVGHRGAHPVHVGHVGHVADHDTADQRTASPTTSAAADRHRQRAHRRLRLARPTARSTRSRTRTSHGPGRRPEGRTSACARRTARPSRTSPALTDPAAAAATIGARGA